MRTFLNNLARNPSVDNETLRFVMYLVLVAEEGLLSNIVSLTNEKTKRENLDMLFNTFKVANINQILLLETEENEEYSITEKTLIVISPQDSVASGRGCRGVCFLASNQEIVAVLYTV